MLKIMKESKLAEEDPRAEYSVYEDFAWGKTHFKDLKQIQVPFRSYLGWQLEEFKSETLNIDRFGIRETVAMPRGDVPKFFVMGGSVAFGVGSSDEYTIASQIQKRVGEKYKVYNMGQDAFDTYQSYQMLLKQSSRLGVPQVVVSFEGMNEILNLFNRPRRDWSHLEEENIRYFTGWKPTLKRYFEDVNRPLVNLFYANSFKDYDFQVSEERLERVAYEAAKSWDLMRQFCEVIGCQFYAFLQPLSLLDEKQLDFIPKVRERNFYKHKIMHRFYKSLKETLEHSPFDKLQKHFISLENIFDGKTQAFIDRCHLAPLSNGIVADKMLELIK